MLFGKFLVKNLVISEDTLQKGLLLQKDTNKPIGETLVEMGAIEKEKLNDYLDVFLP